MTSLESLPDEVRTKITSLLMAFVVLALLILYVFRDRYCRVCKKKLHFKERHVDPEGYDICNRHSGQHPTRHDNPDHHETRHG